MKHNNSKQWKVQPLIPWWRPCRWQSGRSGWSPAGPNTTPTPPLSPWPVSGTRHLSTNSRHTETRSQNRQSTWSPNAAQPLPGTVHPRVSLRVPAAEEGGLLEVGHGCSAPSSWGGFLAAGTRSCQWNREKARTWPRSVTHSTCLRESPTPQTSSPNLRPSAYLHKVNRPITGN